VDDAAQHPGLPITPRSRRLPPLHRRTPATLPMKKPVSESRRRNLALTAGLAERGVTLMNTNFTVPEIVGGYRRFSSVSGWTFRQHALPGTLQTVGNQSLFQPDQDMVRQLLFGS